MIKKKKIIIIIQTQIGDKNSNSLRVIRIMIRGDVNGIGVIVWIEIVSIERDETEKRTTTINCNSVWEKEVKKNNYRNNNNKIGSAGEECVFENNK